MHLPLNSRTQKGFTLIELLIVILIVSIVYFLGFSGVELDKSKPKALTPLNLKKMITHAKWFEGKISLLCVNKCKTCLLRKDISSQYIPYNNGIDLHDIEAYTIDASDMLTRIVYERYNDKEVCLKMDFYPNGSSTQIILKNDKGAYFLPTYFEDAKRFETPEDAKDYWLKNTQLVSNRGDYY